MDLKDVIVDIPDFPKKGITFRDITPVLEDPDAMQYAAETLAAFAKEVKADAIAAPEARGFVFALPAALEAHLPFIPVRKPGKLPRKTIKAEYALEYGTDALEMHADAVKPGWNVLIIDDLLATGGTCGAMREMIKEAGGNVAGYAFVAELDDLNGRDKLCDAPVLSLIHYEGE